MCQGVHSQDTVFLKVCSFAKNAADMQKKHVSSIFLAVHGVFYVGSIMSVVSKSFGGKLDF